MAAEPVTAGITMWPWPPYWVVPLLRNQVAIGALVGMPRSPRNAPTSASLWPSPCTSATVPATIIASS